MIRNLSANSITDLPPGRDRGPKGFLARRSTALPPRKLPALRCLALLSGWIAQFVTVGGASEVDFRIKDADRTYWAFQPLQRLPADTASGTHSVDHFISAKLAAKGLTINPPAGKRELIRRATFALTGLPPTPEEVAAFEQDTQPDSDARLIDRLLALPRVWRTLGPALAGHRPLRPKPRL